MPQKFKAPVRKRENKGSGVPNRHTTAPAGLGATRELKPTHMEIRRLAALAAVKILNRLDLPCAIFGSMACKLYGTIRNPIDVDILVSPSPGSEYTLESIKEAIVSRDPDHFMLKEARDPEATYRVLYYRVSESITSTSDPLESSKIDILLPGIMHLPSLPAVRCLWKGDLPVVPFSVLLLQKLQGWDDHRTATEARYIEKAPLDAMDLAWLLGMKKELADLDAPRWYAARDLFTEEFEALSRERVKRFCAAFPQRARVWRDLGFETE